METDLRVILKAELDKDSNHRVIMNDELIRFGHADHVNAELRDKKQLLPRLGCEESEVETYKLERILKFIDDYGSSNSWELEYEDDNIPKEDTFLEDEFVRM